MARTTRRQSLKFISAGAIASAAGHITGGRLWALANESTFASRATAGPARSLSPVLFGLNCGDDMARYLDNKSFMRTLGQLAPPILRYPGGNGANWFDMLSGVEVKNPVVPKARMTPTYQGTPFTFASFKPILDQAHAEPSIVMNLLTGSLDRQIEALKQAKALGIPVTRLELGNEYYLQGLPGSEDAYATVFPDGVAYAHVANQWAKALKREFPECHIGVPVGGFRGARGGSWNHDLLSNISPDIDAIIPHIYHDPPASTFGGKHNEPVPGAITLPGSVQTILAMALVTRQIGAVMDLADTYKRRVWVTETNVRDFGGSIAGTWTHGLFVALDLMNMLLMLPHLDQALIHALVGGTTYGAILTDHRGATFPHSNVAFQPDTLSASGYGCMMLFKAAQGKTSTAPLKFDNNPTQKGPGELPSLYGWAFGGSSALILNIAAESCDLTMPDPKFSAAKYFQLAGDPTKYVGISSPLVEVRGESSGHIKLPPYSMTLIGA